MNRWVAQPWLSIEPGFEATTSPARSVSTQRASHGFCAKKRRPIRKVLQSYGNQLCIHVLVVD